MSAESKPAGGYIRGPSRAQKQYARFETKPGYDSGSGYERWRSYERREHTARKGGEDVYVYVHRLTAVVACFPDDMAVGEILEALDGCDVHHQSGFKFDNRPDNLAIREHGTHAEITNAQLRAWAEQDKRRAQEIEQGALEQDQCDRCGESADVLATSEGFRGERCLECARETAGGNAIEL